MTYKYNDGGRGKAGYQGQTGDCVCRAIAIATGIDYQFIYDSLSAKVKTSKRMKERGQTTCRNGVHKTVYRKFIEDLGFTWIPTMQVGSGCKVHLKAEELPKGTLIVRVSKHLTAVIDGVINDTYDCSREGTRCVYGYWQKEVA